MLSEESSEPIRPVRLALSDSLRRWLSAADMLSISESLTDDSESLADRVPLTDS